MLQNVLQVSDFNRFFGTIYKVENDGRHEKCIQNFYWMTWWKRPLRHMWEENIRVDLEGDLARVVADHSSCEHSNEFQVL